LLSSLIRVGFRASSAARSARQPATPRTRTAAAGPGPGEPPAPAPPGAGLWPRAMQLRPCRACGCIYMRMRTHDQRAPPPDDAVPGHARSRETKYARTYQKQGPVAEAGKWLGKPRGTRPSLSPSRNPICYQELAQACPGALRLCTRALSASGVRMRMHARLGPDSRSVAAPGETSPARAGAGTPRGVNARFWG